MKDGNDPVQATGRRMRIKMTIALVGDDDEPISIIWAAFPIMN